MPVLPVSPVFAGVTGVVGGLFCGGPCCALVYGAGVAGVAGVTGFCGAWPVLQKAGQRGRLRSTCGCWLFKGQLVAEEGEKAGLEVCFYIVAYIV